MALKENTFSRLLVGALITGIVYFVVQIIIVSLQTKSEKLKYYVTETQPFQAQVEKGFYNVVIANEGEKPLSDLKALLNVTNGVIKEWKVKAEASLDYTDTVIQDSTYQLTIPNINPDDTLAVTIYVESGKTLPTEPKVSLRSKEINGVRGERPRKTGTGLYQGMGVLVAILSAFAAYTLSFFVLRKRSKQG